MSKFLKLIAIPLLLMVAPISWASSNTVNGVWVDTLFQYPVEYGFVEIYSFQVVSGVNSHILDWSSVWSAILPIGVTKQGAVPISQAFKIAYSAPNASITVNATGYTRGQPLVISQAVPVENGNFLVARYSTNVKGCYLTTLPANYLGSGQNPLIAITCTLVPPSH